jgi:intracellular sulfur oxidation DsrE/DsrF family protein
MKNAEFMQKTHRRNFLGSLASGPTFMGLGSLASPLAASARQWGHTEAEDADAWFNQIKGKHRIVFDATHPNELFPFAWPKVFLMTNQKTGTAEKDSSVVVILRHSAICYGFADPLWSKYKLGEMMHVPDPASKAPGLRNPFWNPKPGDFQIPGIGNVDIDIDQLQASGVMFCFCDVALSGFVSATAQGMKMDPQEMKKEWTDSLLPGIQLVPSGVWAVGRAQEHGCAYWFAG